jgi:hypothetical protein
MATPLIKLLRGALCATIAASTGLVEAAPASFDVVISAQAGSQEPNIVCVATVMNDPAGPDVAKWKCDGLIPGSTYVAVLGQSPTLGAIPVSFLGQFTATPNGKAIFKFEVEIVNAYIGVNPTLEDPNGIANITGAGALAAGGKWVPLRFFRLYRSTPGTTAPTVFGVAPGVPGGLMVAASMNPFPQ